jgi:transcriptional regulator with PAS, ATPase and Fis domain
VEGEFRQDLFYRVNVIRLEIPPLRERIEDIPLLVDHFVSLLAARKDKAITGVSPEAMRMLLTHSYPGNVRELENIIEHGFVLCPAGLIRPEHLPLDRLPEAESPPRSGCSALEEAERDQIIRTLAENDGNRLATARALGIHKTTLFRKMKKLGIVPPGKDGRSRKKDGRKD